MPFLLIVMTLHVPANSRLRYWPLLAIWPITFAATAMTRTSLRTSVHSFANAEGLGWYLWPLAIAITVVATVLTWGEGSKLVSERRVGPKVLWPYGLLAWTTLVVVLGTFRPFLPGEATTAEFYEDFLLPTTLVSVVAMGVVPRLRYVKLTRALTEAAGGVAFGAFVVAVTNPSLTRLLLGAALAGGVVPLAAIAVRSSRPASRRMVLAHIGMVLILVGALGATATTIRTFELATGEQNEVAGHVITNIDLSLESGDPAVITATVDVDGSTIQPSLAVYPARALRLPELGTHATLFDETQLILRSADDDGSILISANVVHLTHAVWLGSTLIALAAFSALVTGKPQRGKPIRESSDLTRQELRHSP